MTYIFFFFFFQAEDGIRVRDVTGVQTCALPIFWTGNRLFGPPIGLYGALVAASSAMYVLIGHFLSLDMALAFFMSASVFAIALAQRDESGDIERRRWMLLAWAAAALAVLSKGLVGIVLPAGAVVLYALIERDRERWARLHLFPGGLLFLAITAPWFVAVSLANPEFFRFFFIHEHVERFLTREHDRYEPLWYFVPVLLLGIVPWTVSLFPALWSAWPRSPRRPTPSAMPRATFRPDCSRATCPG